MELPKAFDQRIQRRLNEMVEEALIAISRIELDAISHGAGFGSRMFLLQLKEITEQALAATDWALAESEKLVAQSITRSQIAEALAIHLHKFPDPLYERVRAKGGLLMSVPLKPEEEKLHQTLDAELRDYAAGIWSPRKPTQHSPTSTTNNTVNIGGSNQGTIQQAGRNSQQSAAISVEQLSSALDDFSDFLKSCEVDQTTKSEIIAEIDTVKVQLQRQKPNPSVIRAAIQGIHEISFGVAGNILTPYVLALAAAVGLQLT